MFLQSKIIWTKWTCPLNASAMCAWAVGFSTLLSARSVISSYAKAVNKWWKRTLWIFAPCASQSLSCLLLGLNMKSKLPVYWILFTEVNVRCKCEEFCESYGDFYNHLKKQCFSVNFHPSHFGCSQAQNLSGDELVDHIKNCKNISLSCQECK